MEEESKGMRMNADKESLPVRLQLHNQMPVAIVHSLLTSVRNTPTLVPCPSSLRICTSYTQYLLSNAITSAAVCVHLRLSLTAAWRNFLHQLIDDCVRRDHGLATPLDQLHFVVVAVWQPKKNSERVRNTERKNS